MRWLLADVRLPDKVIMLNILTLAVLMNAHKLALVIVNCSCYVYIPTMIDVHLFLHCPFAQSCWSTIGLNVGHTDPFPHAEIFENSTKCSTFHGSNHFVELEYMDARE